MKAAVDRQINFNYKNEAMINYIIMKPLLPSENNNCILCIYMDKALL